MKYVLEGFRFEKCYEARYFPSNGQYRLRNPVCNPVTLNPDLAGIGVGSANLTPSKVNVLLTVNVQVFSSFAIQAGIAVLALAALIILELFSTKPEETPDPDDMKKHDEPPIELQTPLTKHKDNLITALVEFHKAQCYFASTIQITALISPKPKRHQFLLNELRANL